MKNKAAMQKRIYTPADLRRLKRRRAFRRDMVLFMLALPAVLHLILFQYIPMPGIVIAFKNYKPFKGIFGSEWNGFDNFRFFFTSQDALRTIRNTVLYEFGYLLLDLFNGVLIALMLFYLNGRRTVKVYHTTMMLPKFLSIVIVSYIVYAFLSPSYGVANRLIIALGGSKIQWYAEPKYWPVILSITHVWQTLGGGCLYYYAALMAVDNGLFEAARLDGANRLQEIWHVCVPCLVPVMCITTILGIGSIFSGDFGLHYQVTRNQGILYETTDIINTYTFRALMDGNMARSAAVGLFQSVVGLILVVTTNGIVRKVSPENSMF